ncbi:MAG: hypothetical protein D6717_00375 [Gammaproteobacteria bacterium]|nr:MAG: hypothetical protein D6717_00375 [Gammaproteobacteria bacterium]
MSEPGYPFVAGAGQSGGALVVGGLAESSVGLLLAGQHVSVGGSFYTLTADVDSDQFGRATLAIAPDLRAVPADRTPVSFLSDSIESGAADLGVDAGLHTAVVLSLICDAAAEAPAGSERRGWWADAYAEVDGDRFGSHDWLLRREKQTSEVLLRAEDSARKALGWMIEDGIASRVDVAAAWSDTGDLERKITVVRPDASQLEISIDNAWRNT